MIVWIDKLMMACNKVKLTDLTLIGIFCTSLSTHANDISQVLRNNGNDTDGGYFELGVGVYTKNSPSMVNEESWDTNFYTSISGSYQWHGIFIEAYGESMDPLTFGYNAINYQSWSFDIVIGPRHDYIDPLEIDALGNFIGPVQEERLSGIEERNVDMLFGGRFTYYFDENVLQLQAKTDVAKDSHGGNLISLLFGRNWQLRNWNFHGLFGIEYRDKKIANYYVGVSEEEAQNSKFDQYNTGSSFTYTTEVGLTYPLTEDWVFRSTAKYVHFPSELINSPLFIKSQSGDTELSTSISYVF